MRDMFLPNMPPPPMGCVECEPGYREVEVKNGERRCVRDNMFWDCMPQPAITAPAAAMTAANAVTAAVMGRPALPKGPDNCEQCFMFGTQVGCEHCKAGFKRDHGTGMCMPDQPQNNGGNNNPSGP